MYQNFDRSITLIDIPMSISIAQDYPRPDVILSNKPLASPHIIHNEPKKQKAREKHAAYTETDSHAEYKAMIAHALSEIRRSMESLPARFGRNLNLQGAPPSSDELVQQQTGSSTTSQGEQGTWCLPRITTAQAPQSRNHGDMEMDDPWKDLEAQLRKWSSTSKGEESFDFNKMMASLGESSDATSPEMSMSYAPARDTVDGLQAGDSVTPKEAWTSSFHNPTTRAVDLTISAKHTQNGNRTQEYRFRIPPLASVFLSDVTNPAEFRASFRELTEDFVLPRHFDFILLDPPWPSGSVKRKGNYEQVGGMPYLRKVLSGLDLDNYLEHNALVAIWITNKQSARDLVLGPGGLFEQWNVGLVEEWLWIKTTDKGEPMFSLDSIWRKPYETLLVGRAAPNSWTTMAASPVVTRRVIAAVPDIHSRKPCLKELIEPFMPDPEDYSALEVFARHLVKGWTSWGNEALKFNWEGYWSSDVALDRG